MILRPATVLSPRGGSGSGDGNCRQSIWVWPLPPAGKLAFVCEWPTAGIPLTRHEIDAQLVLDAVSRAEQLFTDEQLFDTAGPQSASGTVAFTRKVE
jgi:hypothetical protein